MLEKLNKYVRKYSLSPELLSSISGYSIDSINSQLGGRRNIQERLILFLELYDKHEETKKSFNIELFKIEDKYKTLVQDFENKFNAMTRDFEKEADSIFIKTKK